MSKTFDPDKSWIHLHFMSQFMRLTLRNFLDAGISLSKAYILFEINMMQRSHLKPTISELVECTGLPKSTVSRTVGELLSAGYVFEQIDPIDRRQRVFSLVDQTSNHPLEQAVTIALEQIEEFLGPNAENELRLMFNRNMKNRPDLAERIDTRPLNQIRKDSAGI